MNMPLPMRTLRRLCSLTLGALLLVTATPAQGQDPSEEIKELARVIDEQLQQIDQLLLESGRSNQSRAKPREMLKEATEKSLTVQDGIDKLIEKLNQMKSQSGGGGGGEQQQQQQQGGQQDQQQDGQSKPQSGGKPGERRENQTPDFVQQPQQGQQPGEQQPGQQGEQQPGQPQPGQQPGEQPGQQPQPKPGEGQPQGGQKDHDGGQNRSGNQPQQDEIAPGQPGTGEASWGELQRYTNFLKNRGVTPKVSEKYRKYYEAYLKQKQSGGK